MLRINRTTITLKMTKSNGIHKVAHGKPRTMLSSTNCNNTKLSFGIKMCVFQLFETRIQIKILGHCCWRHNYYHTIAMNAHSIYMYTAKEDKKTRTKTKQNTFIVGKLAENAEVVENTHTTTDDQFLLANFNKMWRNHERGGIWVKG